MEKNTSLFHNSVGFFSSARTGMEQIQPWSIKFKKPRTSDWLMMTMMMIKYYYFFFDDDLFIKTTQQK